MLTKRERELLRSLLEENDYRPAIFFKKQLDVSTKTIYKDVENIQFELNRLNMKIEKIPRKGLKLLYNEKDREKINFLILYESSKQNWYTPDSRKLMVLGKELFSDEILTYQEYGDLLYVTPQTIKNDRDEIVDFFLRRKIVFSKIREAYYDESVIQKIVHDYLKSQEGVRSNITNKINLLFEDELIEKVESYVDDILERANVQLSNYMMQSLVCTLLIFLTRIKIGKHIENGHKMIFLEIQNMELYMSSIILAERINKELGLVFTTEDIQYLSACLFSHGIQPFVESDVDEYFEDEIFKMIGQMSVLLGVDFTNDKDLPKFLVSHVIPMVYRLNTGIHVKNPLLTNIKKQYSTMFSLVRLVISEFEKSFKIMVTDDEIGFLTIHFQLAFEKIEVTKHVLIVCSFGLVTSELILNRLERNLSKNIIFEISDEESLHKIDFSVVDLIISTVPLEKKIKEIPTIYVNPLPSNEEISMISSKISKIDQFEQNLSSTKTIKKDLIIHYLDPRLLFFKREIATKEEVLTFLSEKMIDLNFVDESFKEYLFKREASGSTGLDIGVAFPHADPKTVRETKLSIICLKKPIKWGQTTVKLVCLVAISESDMSKAKNIISTLYDLFSETGFVKQLSNANSINELTNLIVLKGE